MCEQCGQSPTPYRVFGYKGQLVCGSCLGVLKGDLSYGASAMINTDGIPGGLEIRHGLCNPDGTPRKFYSKSDIKRVAFESGWTVSGETPKPNPRLQDQRAHASR